MRWEGRWRSEQVMHKRLATMKGVRDEVKGRTEEVGRRAERLLEAHRVEGHAEIEIVFDKVDCFVVLSDDRGRQAALSIEYGREAGIVERKTRDGQKFEVEVGEMEGLYILADASHLPRKRKGKVRLRGRLARQY